MKKILLFSLITSVAAALATYYKDPSEPAANNELPMMQQLSQKNFSPNAAHALSKEKSSESVRKNVEKEEIVDVGLDSDKPSLEIDSLSISNDNVGRELVFANNEDDISQQVSKVASSVIVHSSNEKERAEQDIEINIPENQPEPQKEKAPTISQDLDVRSIAELKELASIDSRAAFDLGLRYFRGDGVEQNSYQAIEWMRIAGENGNLNAQAALGRIYLTGLEEMGPDYQEAHKWLLIAAARGDEGSSILISQAEEGRNDEQKRHRLKQRWYMQTSSFWYSKYAYKLYWHNGRWVVH